MASLTSKSKDRKGKKTVCLVGMAQTSRHAVPWNDKDVDIWVLNESHAHNYIKRLTRIFQMHPKWDYMRRGNFNDPFYPEFLQNLPWTEEDIERLESTNVYKEMPRGWPEPKVGSKRRPEDIEIVLLKDDEKIPASRMVYPFKNIMEEYDNDKKLRYFTSSAPYMVALAIHEGYERIEVYGFEMSSQEEYGYQKPCFEFWLGMAMGKGLEVYIPPGCRLLGETTKLYGYDKIPGYTKMHAEIRRNALGRERSKAERQLNAVTGQFKQIQQQYRLAAQKGDKAWMKSIESKVAVLQEERMKALANLNAVHGAYLEASRIWKQLQNLPISDDVKPIIPDKT